MREVLNPDIHPNPDSAGPPDPTPPKNQVWKLDVSSFEDATKPVDGPPMWLGENAFVLSLWADSDKDPQIKCIFSEDGLEELAEEIQNVLGRGSETSTPQPPLAGDGTQAGDGSQAGGKAR